MVLLFHTILKSRTTETLNPEVLVPPITNEDLDFSPDATNEGVEKSYFTKHVERLGGPVIVTFRCVRLLCCVALLVSSLYTVMAAAAPADATYWLYIALCSTYVSSRASTLLGLNVHVQAYVSLLSTLSVVAGPRLAKLACRHLTTVLVATWGVYVYRDIWPLATFTLTPLDQAEGLVLWVRLGLLSVAGVVVPLVSPRQYIPIDPKVN